MTYCLFLCICLCFFAVGFCQYGSQYYPQEKSRYNGYENHRNIRAYGNGFLEIIPSNLNGPFRQFFNNFQQPNYNYDSRFNVPYRNQNFNNGNSNYNNDNGFNRPVVNQQQPQNCPNNNNNNYNYDNKYTGPNGNRPVDFSNQERPPYVNFNNAYYEDTATQIPNVNFPGNNNGGFDNIGKGDVVMVVNEAQDLPPSTQKIEPTTQRTTRTRPTTTESGLQIIPSFESRNDFAFQDTCQTVVGGVGSCVSLLKCNQYAQLLQQGQNPAVVQLLRLAHCGFEGTIPKVCCPSASIPNVPPPTLPPQTQAPVKMPDVTSNPKSVDNELFVDELPEPPVCGVGNGSFTRVVGGEPAKLGEFPWMALLGYRGRSDPSVPRWLCGGSLISSRHVLTAAHCIHGRENDLYQVRLGELDLERDDDGATPIDVPIKTKIKHEEYSPTAFSNDIGVLVLAFNVQFTRLIKPICLPMTPELRSTTFEKYTPFIAGWGDVEFRGPSASHLQKVQLPVQTNEKCANAYAAYKMQTIDHKVLCAGYDQGAKDACQGDSGGPLMQPILSNGEYYYYQIGVVSFGRRCAEAGYPGVYSRVTYFQPWIEETITGRAN